MSKDSKLNTWLNDKEVAAAEEEVPQQMPYIKRINDQLKAQSETINFLKHKISELEQEIFLLKRK